MNSKVKNAFPNLSLGHFAALACQLEAAVAKPGNVHPAANFSDLCYLDFVIAGQIVGDVIDRQTDLTLAQMIHSAACSTRQALGTNVNLGIILLLCPLAKWLFEQGTFESSGMDQWLRKISQSETRQILDAIRIAAPGGIGSAARADVNNPESELPQIIEAMELSRERDQIARQWCTGFSDILFWFGPQLKRSLKQWNSLPRAVIATHLRWLARESDSLVVRKSGQLVGQELQQRAQSVVELLNEDWHCAEPAIAEFDLWLRSDGHRRNPGTTADLICAGLFVLLVSGELVWDRHA